MEFKSKRAITFLEVVIAVAVMAVAMIPVFGVISRQTVETDKNASQAFAINKATEILNALLDNVSFVALRDGNPGFIRVDDLPRNGKYDELDDKWAKKMASMLFNSTIRETNGYPCRGIITDSKGISYLIHLRVEDVPSTVRLSKPERIKIGESYPDSEPTEFPETPEVVFSFLKNPSILSSAAWTQDFAEDINEADKPLTELEVITNGVSESPSNFYGDGNYVNPTAERFTAKMAMKKVPYATDKTFEFCPFKRLVVQIQWNTDKTYFSKPEIDNGSIQRIHLMAIKGDIY